MGPSSVVKARLGSTVEALHRLDGMTTWNDVSLVELGVTALCIV